MTAPYRFGPVTLTSALELPELPPATAHDRPAVSIEPCGAIEGATPRWFHAWIGEGGQEWLRIGREESGYRLEFPRLAEFALSSDGARIRACCREASPETFRHLLLDQVMPLVLAHQGWCVLHAAAVAAPGGAAAFLGATGFGKSTIAASLASTGLRAITDDTLIVSAPPDKPVVGHAAYPSIRVWPETASTVLGPEYRHDGRVSEFNDKVRVGAASGLEFVTAGTPLHALYVLTPDPAAHVPRVETIPPRDRVIEVVRHAFVLDWEGADRLRAAFERLSRVIDRVSVRRLRFRHAYAELPAVRQTILDDLQHAA